MIYEKADTVKVCEQIRKDVREATSEALRGVEKTLAGRGFSLSEIKPLIRQGAREAVDNHK